VVARLVDDLNVREQLVEDPAHGPVDRVRALGSARDVHDGEPGVEAEEPARLLA
jgi:hypothetical protein